MFFALVFTALLEARKKLYFPIEIAVLFVDSYNTAVSPNQASNTGKRLCLGREGTQDVTLVVF